MKRGGILAIITSGSDTQYATITDLNTGNYVVTFAPGKAGTYGFGVKFWGDGAPFATQSSYQLPQTFFVNPKQALPIDFYVTPNVGKVSPGASAGVVTAGHVLDFLVNSTALLPSDYENAANVNADKQYFGANGISDQTWLATKGVTNIHNTYVPPTPDSLVITRDVSKKERYFWFSETVAGRYTVRVMLGNDHVGASPYSIRVAGGPSVNHLGSENQSPNRSGTGVGSIAFALDADGVGAPSDTEDQLGAWTAAASTHAAGATLAIDFDLRVSISHPPRSPS